MKDEAFKNFNMVLLIAAIESLGLLGVAAWNHEIPWIIICLLAFGLCLYAIIKAPEMEAFQLEGKVKKQKDVIEMDDEEEEDL